MAKKWLTSEVAIVLANGTDKGKIMDIGARFPLLAVAIQKAIDNGGNDVVELLKNFPEKYMSAQVVNGRLKEGVERFTDAEEDEETSKKKTKKDEKKVTVPAEFDEDSNEVDYDEMSAKELYLECKKRGIKCKPKQAEKHYITKLKSWDKKNAAPVVAEEDDDDWGEEEVETPKAKKERPAKEKKPKKAPKPEPEDDDEDDDEDWDI